MTNEELNAIRERNGRREQVVASQRRNHGHHTWWREDAPGLVAITDCATLLAELDRLRPKAEAWEAHHCPITLGEWLGGGCGARQPRLPRPPAQGCGSGP